MPQTLRRLFKSLPLACALTGCLLPSAPVLGRQEPTRPPQEDASAAQDDEETVRIETELIQTGVMVFDKSGKFVDRLRQDDFELSVEGSPTQLSFFERIAGAPPTPAPTGGRGGAKNSEPNAARAASASGARTVILFADDLHLSFVVK